MTCGGIRSAAPEPSARGDGAMYAMLITFHSAADLDSLAMHFADEARALQAAEGLILTTWIHDGPTLGRFHVFVSHRAAEDYLASDLMVGLTANPAFTQIQIHRYAVMAELSRATGTPRPLTTERRGVEHLQPRRGGT